MTDIETIRDIVSKGNIEWSAHALRKMIERGITRDAVKHILCHGEIIERYPEDHPFPSVLIFGVLDETPLHAVAAFDEPPETIFVITAYQPDQQHFNPDYKTRRTDA